MAKYKRKDRLVWGIILIVISLFFLLHLDIWYFLAHFWPVVLILWGVWKLYYGIKELKEESENIQD
ncbi:unnamed protein product [marine sediment metagenome]|uniref:DUF5668 domain-containing protein n=1 Tax=marine sediment metagenome TaxID=412755 RepID=X0SUD1_9ZZZZ|nr:hypothetical protein [Candidatus Aminicenantes bacterium]